MCLSNVGQSYQIRVECPKSVEISIFRPYLEAERERVRRDTLGEGAAERRALEAGAYTRPLFGST